MKNLLFSLARKPSILSNIMLKAMEVCNGVWISMEKISRLSCSGFESILSFCAKASISMQYIEIVEYCPTIFRINEAVNLLSYVELVCS